MARFIFPLLLILFIGAQVTFWNMTKDIVPNLAIVPELPSNEHVAIASLGDKQWYFRHLGYQIQNAGDSFGRFTALKNYDYVRLRAWFELLDQLESRSHFIPALAAYYYSQTQYTPDVRYVIDYLQTHSQRNSYNQYHKWWWLAQATNLANFKLDDHSLALELAYQLAATPRTDIPLWTKQMPAFIHEKVGEAEQAHIIIQNIIDSYEDLPDGELNFMHHFLEERLKKLKLQNQP